MEAVLIYSAPCLPDPVPRSSPGDDITNLTTMQVSKSTVIPTGMSEADIKKGADYTSKSIDMAKNLIEIRKLFLDKTDDKDKELIKKLDCVMAIGDILKGVLKFVPGPPNPMVENLQKLDDKLKMLGQKMGEHFDEMKSYITEVNFSVKVITPTATLSRYMRDCITCPGPEAVQNFQTAYERNPPINMAYRLISYLERKTTNPLIMAIDKEKVKTNATFDKWVEIFSQVFGELLYLETFAAGYIGNGSLFNVNQLIDRISEVAELMKKWRTEYGKTNFGYWNDAKQNLKSILEDKAYKSNEEKADALQKKMNNYITSDSFYIIVYDHKNSNHENRVWSKNVIGNDQLITLTDCDGANAFVYCSKKANSMAWDELDGMRKKVQAFKTEKYSKGKLLAELKETPIKGAGFMLIIGGLHEEVRSANFTRHDDGPGWYTYHYPWGGAENQRLLAGCE